MNQKRYTNNDLEKAYQNGFKKGRTLIIKDILYISNEFIHPKLKNQFKLKLMELK